MLLGDLFTPAVYFGGDLSVLASATVHSSSDCVAAQTGRPKFVLHRFHALQLKRARVNEDWHVRYKVTAMWAVVAVQKA